MLSITQDSVQTSLPWWMGAAIAIGWVILIVAIAMIWRRQVRRRRMTVVLPRPLDPDHQLPERAGGPIELPRA